MEECRPCWTLNSWNDTETNESTCRVCKRSSRSRFLILFYTVVWTGCHIIIGLIVRGKKFLGFCFRWMFLLLPLSGDHLSSCCWLFINKFVPCVFLGWCLFMTNSIHYSCCCLENGWMKFKISYGVKNIISLNIARPKFCLQ